VGRAFWIGAAALATSAVLVGLAIVASLTLALVILSVILWGTLFGVTRALQRERSALHCHADELRNQYDPIIATLSGALGLQDGVTVGHGQRVSALAAAVAEQMGLRHEQIRLVEKAAILHDIGKIGIAEDVLSKTGTLTEQEWAQMRRHAELGYEVFNKIDSLSDIADIVHSHHERFDGQGYPRRIKGEEIPLGARIFAVVDAYVAMTSSRPYRKKLSHDMAVQEIVRNSLTQFDPQVVRAFMEANETGLLTPVNRGEHAGNGQLRAVASEA
jgi:putative nucleotidyltransferase with HDIG domain